MDGHSAAVALPIRQQQQRRRERGQRKVEARVANPQGAPAPRVSAVPSPAITSAPPLHAPAVFVPGDQPHVPQPRRQHTDAFGEVVGRLVDRRTSTPTRFPGDNASLVQQFDPYALHSIDGGGLSRVPSFHKSLSTNSLGSADLQPVTSTGCQYPFTPGRSSSKIGLLGVGMSRERSASTATSNIAAYLRRVRGKATARALCGGASSSDRVCGYCLATLAACESRVAAQA